MVSPDSRLGTVGIYIQYIYITKIVVLVSEPVRGRSRATELPCYNLVYNIDITPTGLLLFPCEFVRGLHMALRIGWVCGLCLRGQTDKMTVADTVTVTSGRGQLWRGDM